MILHFYYWPHKKDEIYISPKITKLARGKVCYEPSITKLKNKHKNNQIYSN